MYDVLHDDLHWFERFQREVAVWLRDRLDKFRIANRLAADGPRRLAADSAE